MFNRKVILLPRIVPRLEYSPLVGYLKNNSPWVKNGKSVLKELTGLKTIN